LGARAAEHGLADARESGEAPTPIKRINATPTT